MKDRAISTIVKPNMTIKDVMLAIQNEPHAKPPGPGHIALVTDEENKLLGTITDGDIRRALLKGKKLTEKARSIMKSPIAFSAKLEPDEILQTLKRPNNNIKRLEYIVTVDESNRVHDVFSFFDLWKLAEVKNRSLAVVGLGYVGLTLSLVLAESEYTVVGIDTNKSVIKNLNSGKTQIHEKDIISLLKKHIGKNFIVQNNFKKSKTDAYIVCVGTPIDKNNKVDTKPLKKALQAISSQLKMGDLIILRSTLPVGTCRKLAIPLIEKLTKLKVGEDISFAFAPERTLEGDAINELKKLPQIIAGFDKKSTDLAIKVFENVTESIVLVDTLESAELTKLLNNTYRDLTFAFANEAALFCNKLNLDSQKIIRAANQGYSRANIPKPSPGVGGPCLTKDSYLLAESMLNNNLKPILPLASRSINEQMVPFVVKEISDFIENLGKPKSSIKIFALGMAFKGRPETADIRNSTGVTIARNLKEKFPKLKVYDPIVKSKDLAQIGLKTAKIDEGFQNADCILILNNHPAFLSLDMHKYLKSMNKPGLLFDPWAIFESSLSRPAKGIIYKTL